MSSADKAADSAAEFLAAESGFTYGVSDPDPLVAAAKAHLKAARPLAEVLAEYKVLQDAEAAGETFDAEAYRALGQEAGTTRMASEAAAGNLPGKPPEVTVHHENGS